MDSFLIVQSRVLFGYLRQVYLLPLTQLPGGGAGLSNQLSITFKAKFGNGLKPALLAFKAARYFSPSKVHEMKLSVTDLDSLSAFTFLNSQVIDGLK